MTSRNLYDLHPDVMPLCVRFIAACREHGIDILVTCTYRSMAEQDALYAKGRTAPGRIVTNARGGYSLHNVTLADGTPAARAFDVVPLRAGKPVWGTSGDGIDDNPADDDKDDLELWQRVGAIGEACGLEWAGRWRTFREFPHFQLPELVSA